MLNIAISHSWALENQIQLNMFLRHMPKVLNSIQIYIIKLVYDICRIVGSGIMNLNLCKKDPEYNVIMTGVFSKNREEWLCLEIAGLLYNF